MEPAFLSLHRSGELARRAQAAARLLESCSLCPRNCGVNRLKGETGFCGAGARAVVASFCPHFGEEAPISGTRGSGTIFFAGCNLGCVFCQNSDISTDPANGLEATPEELAGVMLELQGRGCHNINLVTPTHVLPQILAGLDVAARHGLHLPLVWNCGGYEGLEALRLLDGAVDIFMPDVKAWDPAITADILRAPDYPEHARRAVAEMHRQVGDLVLDRDGVAVRGLLVRHLVLPEGMAGTGEWMRFLAALSPETYVNVMEQYRPCHRAHEHPGLSRPLSRAEWLAAVDLAKSRGISRLDRDRASKLRLWA